MNNSILKTGLDCQANDMIHVFYSTSTGITLKMLAYRVMWMIC